MNGSCGLRVIRGGSWFNLPVAVRSAIRGGNARADRIDYSTVGFRLAQDK